MNQTSRKASGGQYSSTWHNALSGQQVVKQQNCTLPLHLFTFMSVFIVINMSAFMSWASLAFQQWARTHVLCVASLRRP
jgi:hypothetical protein